MSDIREVGGTPVAGRARGGSEPGSPEKKPRDLSKPVNNVLTVVSLNVELESEWNFVLNSWKRTARPRSPKIPSWIFFSMLHESIMKLVGRGASFRCIRNPSNPDQIFGHSVVEGDVAHFVFVKRWFRRRGIATALVEGARYGTFWTPAGEPLFRKIPLRRIDL